MSKKCGRDNNGLSGYLKKRMKVIQASLQKFLLFPGLRLGNFLPSLYRSLRKPIVTSLYLSMIFIMFLYAYVNFGTDLRDPKGSHKPK